MMRQEFADLDSGRIFPSRFFEPVSESLGDIIIHTKPYGKRVLSVAAYGYPLAFLSEGGKEVLSFDVDGGKIAWNHFLRASILVLDYSEHLSYLRCESKEPEIVGEKVKGFLPSEYAQEAINQMWMFHLCYPHLAERIRDIYPHVRDEGTYHRVQQVVRGGGWEISQSELLALIKEVNANQPERRFDVMYVSSIRNWVLDAKYKNDVQRFEKEYDRELGRLVNSIFDEDGVFYEVLISAQDFPRVKISPRFYRGFDNNNSYALPQKLIVG